MDFDAERLLKDDRYTPEDLAKLLDLPVYTITNAVWEKQLQAHVADHQILWIDRSEVIRWVREHF